jgi:hypothetical protein
VDEDEVDRLLWELGLELPEVADDGEDDLPLPLDEQEWE